MSSEEKSFLEKTSEGLSSIGQTVSSATESATTAINNTKENVGNTLNEYSSKNVINASTGFLNSNGMIAKFIFLIFILSAFIFLFYLGIQLIGFFTGFSTSVYVISGLIPDMSAYNIVISTDYTQKTTDKNVAIMRSNNQTTGLEFTWCSWLNLKPIPVSSSGDKFKLIYVKGTGVSNNDKNISTTNCPGVYVYNNNNSGAAIQNVDTTNNNTSLFMRVMIDTVTQSVSSQNLNTNAQVIDISNIPINKWFHLAIRCQNKNIDVYVNGTIYMRKILDNPPRQNSDSIHVCDSNPPGGSISDLRYFAYALSVIDINRIVNYGPNLTINAGYAKSSANQDGKFKTASYLANNWYNKY